jgi:hypothetical protein
MIVCDGDGWGRRAEGQKGRRRGEGKGLRASRWKGEENVQINELRIGKSYKKLIDDRVHIWLLVVSIKMLK